MGIAITGICGCVHCFRLVSLLLFLFLVWVFPKTVCLHSGYRQMAVKEGAAIAGVNGNFHALASEPFQILRPPPHINAATTVKVRNRVARFSCGFWDGNGPRNQITWFITKVRPRPRTVYPYPL